MNTDYPKFKIFATLAAGLAAFGFAPILVRYAADYSPMLVAAIRTIAAFLLLLPVYLVRRKKEKAQVAAITDDGIWVLAAGISLGIHFLLWIGSLYYTSVASASVLVTINPILLIIAERMIFKVRFKGAVWIGVLVAFSGSALLGYSDYNTESTFANPLLGNMMALSAAAIFVVYFLIGRKIRQNRTWLGYVFPVYGYAALTCLAVLLIVEGIPSSLPLEVLLVGLGLAIGPQIMGHGSLNYAVKYVSPTLLSTLVLTEPLIATILAFLFFGEWPELLALGAIVITLAGVVLSWRKKPEHEADEQT